MIFDINGLRSSLGQICETWHGVVYRLCSFSQLRRILRVLTLVYCLPVSERDIGSWRSSRTSHGR